MRCSHPHCRTSLSEESAVYCPHLAWFCEHCTWEEACDECATEDDEEFCPKCFAGMTSTQHIRECDQ